MAIRTPHAVADEVSKQEILDALVGHAVHLTDADIERVGRYVRALRSGSAAGRNVVVVKGEPPVHGRDGRIVDLVAAAAMKVDQQGNVSHYDHNVLGVVSRGQPVLKIEPPTRPRPGRDVFGAEIPADEGVWPELELGEHLSRSEDGLTVSSDIAGRFRFADGRAEVEPDLNVESDVSFHSGNIDFEKDVIVDKDVFTKFEVKTPRSVVINGAVEGATIEAGQDVRIKHGILGKRKGVVIAGGDITCQFANGARLTAGGNITIDKYCYDSAIKCRYLSIQGVLAGGEISCTGGSKVGVLGSEGHRTTTIKIRSEGGRTGKMTRLHGGVSDAEQKLAELQEAYAPYRGRRLKLKGQAREKADRIHEQIKALEKTINQSESGISRLTTDSGACKGSFIEVTQRAFAGVFVQFEDLRAVLRNDLVGPHRLELRRAKTGLQVVAVNLRSGRTTTLPPAPEDLAA